MPGFKEECKVLFKLHKFWKTIEGKGKTGQYVCIYYIFYIAAWLIGKLVKNAKKKGTKKKKKKEKVNIQDCGCHRGH